MGLERIEPRPPHYEVERLEWVPEPGESLEITENGMLRVHNSQTGIRSHRSLSLNPDRITILVEKRT